MVSIEHARAGPQFNRYQSRTAAMNARRMFFAGLACTAVLATIDGAAAQPYPSKPVRIIVGLAPGGGVDILARLMGQRLSERLGQPFIIENRPGAGSNIGTEAVVKAPPDGH